MAQYVAQRLTMPSHGVLRRGERLAWAGWAGLGWAGDRGMFPGTPTGQVPSARSITPMEPEVGSRRIGSTAGLGGRRRHLADGEEDDCKDEGAAVDMLQAAPVTKFVSVSTQKILVIGRRMSRSDEPATTPPSATPPAPAARAAASDADRIGGSAGVLIRRGGGHGNWASTINNLAVPTADSVGRQDHPKVWLAGRLRALPLIPGPKTILIY